VLTAAPRHVMVNGLNDLLARVFYLKDNRSGSSSLESQEATYMLLPRRDLVSFE
jgi:hypothetical protein